MAQPELERRRAVSEYSALSGGDFQGIGIVSVDKGRKIALYSLEAVVRRIKAH